MSFEPASKLVLNLRRSLLALLICCLSLPVSAQNVRPASSHQAASQIKRVNVKLQITVIDKESRHPIPNAVISIPRQGTSKRGIPIRDLSVKTDEQGRFVNNDIDFELNGTAHTLTVSSPNYPVPWVKELTDEVLQDGATVSGDAELSRTPPPEIVTPNISITVVDEKTGKPLREAHIFIAQGEASEVQETEGEAAKAVNGKASIKDRQFRLGATPYKLIIKADKYNSWESSLVDDDLRGSSKSGRPINLTARLAPTSGSFDWLKETVNNLLWILGLLSLLLLVLAGLRALIRRRWNPPFLQSKSQASGNDVLGSIHAYIQSINSKLNELKENAATKTELEALRMAINGEEGEGKGKSGKVPTARKPRSPKPGQPEHNPESSPSESPTVISRGGVSQPESFKAPEQRPFQQPVNSQIQLAYKDFIYRNPGSPEPLYLNIEDVNSMAGQLEDNNVYLSQVGNTQGAFVLFMEGNDAGWVYPNPTIKFRPDALKEVFPVLTEGQFEGFTEEIAPKRVRRVEERRWKVEGGEA